MFEHMILLLIQIALVVLAAYVVLWFLGKIGLELPPMVVQIFWAIVVLIVILLLYRMLSPALSGGKLFGLIDGLSLLA